MSARVNTRDFSRNKFAAEKTAKKYCGVCHKAGLSEKEYTSHYTKSTPGEKGIVICPTILNNECSFCYNLGHFKSACPAIAERDRMEKKRALEEKRQYYKEQKQRATEVKKPTSSRNAFAALRDSSDDEAPVSLKRTHSVANEVKEEWPALCSVTAKTTTDAPSFASIAANPPPVKKMEPIRPANICGFTVITKQGIQYTPTMQTNRPSWVDLTDDEEECDAEENDDDFW